MPTQPCSICGAAARSKLCTLYWRWPAGLSDWERFKQRVCADCFKFAVLPVIKFAKEHPSECCHGDETGHDEEFFTQYLTLYTPTVKDGPTWQGEVYCCAKHLQQVRGAMTRGAEDLSGREAGRPAARPDPWADVAV